jgi:outer membrane murein-binding lipoprotein Lpp
MFETLEVKDPREARERYLSLIVKERTKFEKIENEYAMSASRKEVRIEELRSELKAAKEELEAAVSRESYEKERKSHKANVAKWEKVFKEREDVWRQATAKVVSELRTLKAVHGTNSSRQTEVEYNNKHLESKNREYKKKFMEMHKENLRATGMVPTLKAKIQSLERDLKRAESDAKFKNEEAAQLQAQVYNLEVDLESTTARMSDEISALKDRLKLVEGERDALKTSLKEEEVLRIAAEGQILLPTMGDDEVDEFSSPPRSPRKPRNTQRSEENKENMSPKKAAVDLRFIQQELAMERRLRARAEDQIDFMKMECQFQCCSCRIAEHDGKEYIHDNSYAAEIAQIKSTVRTMTPPASNHGDDVMEDVVIEQKSGHEERPMTPPPEASGQRSHDNDTSLIHSQGNEPESVIAFSPTTGTFRSVPSPVKALPKRSRPGFSTSTDSAARSSSRASAYSTTSLGAPFESEQESAFSGGEGKAADVAVHEDAIYDSDEENAEPAHEATGPATPYFTKTTTTTIPISFSPATPAPKPGSHFMSPFTVGHATTNLRVPALGELSLNKVPIDREAALEAIRQRRGRARSMAAGQGTPMKQMVEGVKERRDISAPVSRVRQ